MLFSLTIRNKYWHIFLVSTIKMMIASETLFDSEIQTESFVERLTEL